MPRTAIMYDCEFVERGPNYPIILISIGLAAEDGGTYYAINRDFPSFLILEHPWEGFRQHVWPQLPRVMEDGTEVLDTSSPAVKPRRQIATEVRDFILSYPDPWLWASYSSYDHVVYAQLFGTMAQLPEGMPMHTNDIKTFSLLKGDPEWPKQKTRAHHALNDAEYNLALYNYLKRLPYEELTGA